jgi:hypothetical protein
MDKLDPNQSIGGGVSKLVSFAQVQEQQDRGGGKSGVVCVTCRKKINKTHKKAHAVVEWLTFAGYCPWPRKNWSVFLLGISGHRPY